MEQDQPTGGSQDGSASITGPASGVIDTAAVGDVVEGARGRSLVVSTASCGVPLVRDDLVQRTPQGQHCRVDLRAVNESDESATFVVTTVIGHSAAGQHAVDGQASVYAGTPLLVELPAGGSAGVSAFFDVPADATLERVTVDRGWLGRAVDVPLL